MIHEYAYKDQQQHIRYINVFLEIKLEHCNEAKAKYLANIF